MDKELPFTEHLEELRQRLRKSLIALFVAFLVTFFFREELFFFLQQPWNRAIELYNSSNKDSSFTGDLHFKDITEPFVTYMKVALYSALFVTVPYMLYHIWQFVAPGLYKHEKKATLPFMISTVIMFLTGAGFCYLVAMPFGYFALLTISHQFKDNLMVADLVGTTLTLLLAFGLVFETPVVLIFLCRVGILTPQQLKTFRRYAIVIIFAIAAVLTPPDLLSMLAMAFPLMLLYEVSIIGARFLGKPIPRDEPHDKPAG